jgi:hypothetical protein
LVNGAIPVLHNLGSPQTGFQKLFPALDRLASQVAPVASTQAAWFNDLDTFFSAWAGVAPSLEQAIAGGPAALAQATHSFAFEAKFVENATEFMHLLRPSASALVTVAPQLGHAFSVGAVNLRAATALNSGVAEASQAFQAFAQNPIVTLSLEDLTQTAELGGPLLAGLAPAQAYCNYVTLLLRNVSNLQAENVGNGTLAQAAIVLSPNGPGAEGFPSTGPANGPSIEKNSFGKPVNNNFLHTNPYPNVAGPGQPRLCEAGNEKFIEGKMVVGNLPAGGATNNRELTSREQNLFGEKYPSATLKALGLSKGKKGS